MNYRDISHAHTDRTEDFYLVKTDIHRTHTGIDDRLTWNDHTIDLSYNYMQPERYTFNAVLRNYYKNTPHQGNKSMIDQQLYAQTRLSQSTLLPSLDLYFQRILPRQQTLTLNFTGTLISSERDRRYTETQPSGRSLADIVTNVDGHKRSIIAEVIYDKQFKRVALSAGLRHYQMHDRNKYTGSSPVTSEMDQSRSSFFTEMQGKWKTWSYGISAGATRSWFHDHGRDHLQGREHDRLDGRVEPQTTTAGGRHPLPLCQQLPHWTRAPDGGGTLSVVDVCEGVGQSILVAHELSLRVWQKLSGQRTAHPQPRYRRRIVDHVTTWADTNAITPHFIDEMGRYCR